MKPTSSNLATRAGLIVLLILLFIAAYLHITALEIFMIVLLFLCLAAWLWSRRATDRITVSFRERESHLFPDETVTLHAQLHNRKFLPVIWLHLHVAGSDTGILETASGQEISETFSWIMSHQSISWEHVITGRSRGVCSMDCASLLSGDGFGLSDRSRNIRIDKPFRLVVYPRLIPADHELIRRHIKELELSAAGLYKDPTLLKYIRPYTGRERLRDINWRSLAKGGEEQVNIWETLDRKRAAFLPDLYSFMYLETVKEDNEEKTVRRLHKEEFERMLSLIASLIVHLGERDIYFSLLLPAYAEQAARAVIPEDHTVQIPLLLETLAEIDYNGEDTVFPPEMAADMSHRLGQIYVVRYSPETGSIRLPEDLAARYLVCDECSPAQ